MGRLAAHSRDHETNRVRVSSFEPGALRSLNAAIGHSIEVRGAAFGAQTAHHHAPLVRVASKAAIR